MAKVTTRKETGKLVIDFTYRGVRCREQTALDDTPANRRQADAVLKRLRTALETGEFDYAKFFPGSRLAVRFAQGAAFGAEASLSESAARPAATPRLTSQSSNSLDPFGSGGRAALCGDKDGRSLRERGLALHTV